MNSELVSMERLWMETHTELSMYWLEEPKLYNNGQERLLQLGEGQYTALPEARTSEGSVRKNYGRLREMS